MKQVALNNPLLVMIQVIITIIIIINVIINVIIIVIATTKFLSGREATASLAINPTEFLG